jgi:hypothetical protein
MPSSATEEAASRRSTRAAGVGAGRPPVLCSLPVAESPSPPQLPSAAGARGRRGSPAVVVG